MAETIRIEIPIETIDNTDPELSNVTKNLKKMGEAANSSNTSVKKTNETVSQFDKTAEKTQKSLASWAKEKYEILLEAKDKVGPVLTTLGTNLKSIAGKAWSVTMKAVDLATAPIRGIINLLKNPILQMTAVLGVSVGLKDTIETYMDFEAAMSDVQAISGATTSELEKLTAKAEEMGSTTKFTATEAAEAFNYMAMAGWDTQQMLDGIEGILNLAAASGEDLATTSDIVTDALTAFGLQASDATHFSDVLAKTASSANTTVSEMGETFKYAASMAGTLGYSIEDVGLMVGLMANSGIKGSSAGTYLNTIFTRLSTNTNGATDAIEALGINFFDSTGKARDLSDVIGELRIATANYTDEQKTNLANTIAGTRAQSGLLTILNATEEEYNELAEAINNADGASEEMAETMMDNLSGDITLFQSAVDGLKVSLGGRLSNTWLRDIVQWLTSQVPNVEQALNDAMDFIELRFDRAKRKFSEIANTDVWQNADFLGKAKILWDEFIAQPFSEWWNSTGKAKIAEVAEDIGQSIGSAFKFGILTLLGVDISDTVNEGMSIGKSFAEGFTDGLDFDLIKDKLWDGIKNLFSSAGKLLPGGESADLSSIISAAILAKLASPVLSVGKGLFSTGQTLLGSQESLGGASLMGTMLGSASTGSGLLGFGANTAITLGAGNLAGGASLSAGALSALGLGAVAGGAVGGATLVSGAMDAYTAIKSDDADEKSAYASSAAWKAGGVAAGAAIGSIIPGLGTAVGALVGAGVGGIAGWIKGNKVKEEYQENVEEMELLADKVKAVYNATGVTISDTTEFASKELKDMMHDTEMSAEEFSSMFQESCANLMNEAFGNITLSLTEIKKLAEEITFGDMAESLEEFNSAVSKTESSLSTLKSSVSDLKRENWEVNLGLQLSETEVDSYKDTVDSFVKNAQDYIKNSHYEATVALSLLTNGDGSTEYLDAMYESFTSQVDALSEQLSSSMEIALTDGVITLDESAELINLQQQITDITNKLTEAQSEAELEAIGIKFRASGAELTAESYATLQEQLAAYTEDAAASYEDAMIVSLANIELELSEDAISSEEADALKQEIESAYNAQLADLNLSVTSFNLQTIADAYGSQLDGILPDIEGTTVEKLQTALNNALLQRPDVSSWDESFMLEAFDLDGLSAELQANMESMLLTTAESTPQTVKDQILQSYKDSIPTVDEIIEGLDWENYTTQMYDELTAIIGNTGEHWTNANSDWSIMDPILQGVSEENLNAKMQSYAEGIRSALEANLDPSVVSDFMNSYMTAAADNFDFQSVMEQYGPISNEYYEEIVSQYAEAGTAFGDAMNTSASSSISSGSDLLRTSAQSAIDSAFANPFSAKATINITGNYNLLNPYTYSGSSSAAGTNATGGYVSGRQLSWVGEEGPEAIIPLVPSRRSRALELYEQVGNTLGIGAYANGGIVGGSNSAFNLSDYNLLNDAIRNVPTGYNASTGEDNEAQTSTSEPVSATLEAQGGAGATIQVSVEMSPEFTISGSEGMSEESIMAIIRKNMKAMADEMGGEIAERLEEVFSNMPLKEA